MNLLQLISLQEAKIGAEHTNLAMSKIISYLQKKLGVHLVKIPGTEHYHNSADHGYGFRYVFSGTAKCIRFNWSTQPAVGRTNELRSIDIYDGKHHDPAYSIQTKGITLVKSLPMVASILDKTAIGRQFIFPVNAAEAVTESLILEAKRDDYTAETALDDFMKKLSTGKFFTRSDFIGSYHIIHAGIFDTIIKDFKDKFQIEAKRVSLKPGAQVEALKGSILAKAGVIEVTKGGTQEVFLKTKQEEDVEEAGHDRVPYGDVLEHLEGLTAGVIKGAFNSLFVAGKGGTGKTQTVERVLKEHGMSRGDGYHRIAGAASAAGIYPFLYHHRNDIILFDDCDGALADQDARNIIKSATDTQKVRELSWLKKASFTYDDTDPDLSEDQLETLQTDVEKAPRQFKFSGKVIFISNLPLAKLDPDGALRSRAFIIIVDPTNAELFEHMEKILYEVELEDGLTLSKAQRDEVLDVVKSSKRKGDVSLRKLVRALNIAASGVPGWAKLVELYA